MTAYSAIVRGLLKETSGTYYCNRGEAMNAQSSPTMNEDAVKAAIIEIKLCINQKLYQKGALTEEMYTTAKELILKGE